MKIAVLGTGMVGQAIARRLATLEHDVMMGAREAANEKATAFAAETSGRAGTFAQAAAHGEIVINATSGEHAIAALTAAGADNLAGKVLVDVANPIDASTKPVSLAVSNTDSLGETIQRAFPRARVVKTLCTVTAAIMVDPARLPGNHVIFVSGNDADAKSATTDLLRSFGWREIIDLGDITTARGQEQMLPMWLRLWSVLGTTEFNYVITRASE